MLQSAQSSSSVNPKFPNPEKAPVVISYRLEGKHLGKAAFYDAYTLANHTGFPVSFVHSEDDSIKDKYLLDYIKTQTINIPHVTMNPASGRPEPATLDSYKKGGLLVIPGMTRESYEKTPPVHNIRMKFEKSIIDDALRRGRPILAICAGSWTLWEALGGTLVSVDGHNYGGGMPRINAKGTMTYNVHIHDVRVKKNSLLHTAMALGNSQQERLLPANSIHWMAPNSESLPSNFEVSATARKSPSVLLKTRQKTVMTPDDNTVEAFSSLHGVPILGFVWHPEAFDFKKNSGAELSNSKALLFMAQAGSAYKAKQDMLNDYKAVAAKVELNEVDALEKVFLNMKL
tara:strand:+ start:68262 stop:69293 length:1032 start_codon:yes stop_codon:yes gene_type:complete